MDPQSFLFSFRGQVCTALWHSWVVLLVILNKNGKRKLSSSRTGKSLASRLGPLFLSLSSSGQYKRLKLSAFPVSYLPLDSLLSLILFYMSPFLVMDLWFRWKALWPTYLYMISDQSGSLVELGSCLNWRVGKSLTSLGEPQGWIPLIKMNLVSHGVHIWIWILKLSLRFWVPWVRPCLKWNTSTCHSYLHPEYFLESLFLKNLHKIISWLAVTNGSDDAPILLVDLTFIIFTQKMTGLLWSVSLAMQLEKWFGFWAHNIVWRKGEEQESVPGEREHMIKHWNDIMIKD